MLQQPTLDKLEAMRLHGMAQGLREQSNQEMASELSFEERFALLVDRQMNWRQNEALQARLRRAKLRGNACVEDIDFRASRGLDKSLLRALMQESSWVSSQLFGDVGGICDKGVECKGRQGILSGTKVRVVKEVTIRNEQLNATFAHVQVGEVEGWIAANAVR